jgi:hypothetical protein
MKSFAAICLTFFLYCPLNAQFGRNEIKKSKTAENDVTVIIKSINEAEFYIDQKNTSPKTLREKNYFQSKSDEFNLYGNFINPLEYSITSSIKSFDDELFIASREFITSSAESINKIQDSGKRSKPIVNAPSNLSLEPQLIEMYLVITGQNEDFFEANKQFWEAIGKINFSEDNTSAKSNFELVFKNLKTITSINEIKETTVSNQQLLKSTALLIENVDKRYLEALKELDKINFELSDFYLKSYIKSKLNQLGKEIDEFKLIAKDNSNKYTKLEKLFNEIESKRHASISNKFSIQKILDLNKEKRHEIALIINKINFDNKEKTIKVDSSKTYLINVRKKTTFIPVLSSGVLYTNLSFPQYGTSTNESGETIVSQTADEDNEITIATYLNLYFNNNLDIPTFLQFGVGPSKEKPLFFLGGGAELAPKFTLSGGMVFTWFPELNDLNVGDLVTGTTMIEDDISFNFNVRPKFYLGISIDLTKK